MNRLVVGLMQPAMPIKEEGVASAAQIVPTAIGNKHRETLVVYCNWYWAGQAFDEPNGGGGGGYGTRWRYALSRVKVEQLTVILRSISGSWAPQVRRQELVMQRRQYRYCCGLSWSSIQGATPQRTTGSNGGGAIILWASGLSVRGTVRSNQQATATHAAPAASSYALAQ